MKLLLDTHTLLWFIAGSQHLSAAARALTEDAANEKFVSAASLWETAIKVSIGKMTLATPFDALFPINWRSTVSSFCQLKSNTLRRLYLCRFITAIRLTAS